MTEQIIEQAENFLAKLMEEQPLKFIQVMLVTMAKELVSANAATSTIKQKSTINGNRYLIETKIKITKVKNNTP